MENVQFLVLTINDVNGTEVGERVFALTPRELNALLTVDSRTTGTVTLSLRTHEQIARINVRAGLYRGWVPNDE